MFSKRRTIDTPFIQSGMSFMVVDNTRSGAGDDTEAGERGPADEQFV